MAFTRRLLVVGKECGWKMPRGAGMEGKCRVEDLEGRCQVEALGQGREAAEWSREAGSGTEQGPAGRGRKGVDGGTGMIPR